ncbi:MAG: AAA family ATPase [Denitromonas halophila]|nr:MAG: AAA family ATPase [Denitromonas halophila]
MKLDFVEVCGFRGFREKVRVDFGSGFTIITGRNGVGKSTLCDAVEFALTGSINKYAVEKAAQESLNDYLWWRGEGKPSDHYVTASFMRDDGETFAITRSRNSGADKTTAQIEAAFCHSMKPDDAVRQLCRTSIIRDEWIAALSLDLSETERFELVRSALGPVQGIDFGVKAKAVLKTIETAHAARQDAYVNARTQLTNALTQLSEAKEVFSRAGDVSVAMQTLAAETPNGPEELVARVAAGRAALTAGRARLGAMGEAVAQGRDVLALRHAFDAPDAVVKREAARVRLDTAAKSKAEAERVAADAQRGLQIEEQGNVIAASLAAIIEHGEKLGKHDGHCPLCAASRTDEEFAAGLALARKRMEALASGVAAARQRVATACQSALHAAAELEEAQAAWTAIESERSRLTAREQAHVEIFERHGLDFRFVQDPDGLEQHLIAERERLIDLERALLTLEVSQSMSKIASLEDRVAAFRKDADAVAAQVEASERALATAKAIDRGVRSISGEIIDERLAQISPLLNELYQRLRPHYDWRSIEYSIRGDVRRFLSLKVGDGLNPQFVFSSGQRRAAGLAFLLSVHLTRAWTPWRTLLLDDPVQHIDDFRALHLIEILGAFRLDGRQIVCAVEDPALADLLCRRLLSTSDAIGKRYDIDIDQNGATTIVSEAEIPPMPTGVLRSRSEMHAVG